MDESDSGDRPLAHTRVQKCCLHHRRLFRRREGTLCACLSIQPTDLDPSNSGQTVIAYNVAGKDQRSAEETERAYAVSSSNRSRAARAPPVDPKDLPPFD
jgi:hypothetical protein